MTVIGVPGGIGSGKSTMVSCFGDLGAVVVSGDQIARELVTPGSACLEAIVERFGADVLLSDGGLDRPGLARLVFADPSALADPHAIMDLPIQEEISRRVAAQTGVVVVESPLLIERGRQDTVDTVVVVLAPLDLRLARLHERGIETADAMARIGNQASDDQRAAVADYVIVNDDGVAQLREAVRRIWAEVA